MMSENELRFEVILCSHNGVAFIGEQIESILSQGAVSKLHVHDFASSDGTRHILNGIMAQHGAIVDIVHHADSPGASASFIRAMRLIVPRLSSESVVLLADQDDIWLPGKVDRLTDAICRRGLSPSNPFLLFHDVEVVDEKLNTLRPTYYTGNPFSVPRDLNETRLLMANPVIGHTMLLSRPLVREVAEWPDSPAYMMHDWQTVLIANRIGQVEFVSEVLSLYRQHSANVLGAYRSRRRLYSLPRLLLFVDRMLKQAISFSGAAEERRLSSNSVERGCRRGYRIAAVTLAFAALRYGPTWQRKAISVLLLLRGLIGPVQN